MPLYFWRGGRWGVPVFGNGGGCWRCKEEDLMWAQGGVVGFEMFADWVGGGVESIVTGLVETLSSLWYWDTHTQHSGRVTEGRHKEEPVREQQQQRRKKNNLKERSWGSKRKGRRTGTRREEEVKNKYHFTALQLVESRQVCHLKEPMHLCILKSPLTH